MIQISKEIKTLIIEKYLNDTSYCFLYIEGNKCQNRDDFYEFIKQKLNLPKHFINDKKYINNIDALRDVMSDKITYFEKNKIILIIDSYKSFLKNDDYFKQYLEEIFKDALEWFIKDNIIYGSGELICFVVYYLD